MDGPFYFGQNFAGKQGMDYFCDLYNWMEKALQNSAHIRR